MMRFVAFTDLHIRGDNPRSRKDDYYKAVSDKLRFTIAYAASVQADALLCMGDLFNSENVSHGIENDIISILKESSAPIYACLGSHEYSSYNLGTLRRSGIGVLHNVNLVTVIFDPVVIDDKDVPIVIHATHHTHDLDRSPLNYRITRDVLPRAFHIQLIHGMLLPESAPFEYTKIDDLPRDSIGDIVLCGHYHPGFSTTLISTNDSGEKKIIPIVNPGSLGRVEATSRDLYILDISVRSLTDYTIDHIPVPFNKDVFEKVAGNRTDVERAALISNFLDELSSQAELSSNSDLETTFKMIAQQLKKPQETIDFLIQYYSGKEHSL